MAEFLAIAKHARRSALHGKPIRGVGLNQSRGPTLSETSRVFSRETKRVPGRAHRLARISLQPLTMTKTVARSFSCLKMNKTRDFSILRQVFA